MDCVLLCRAAVLLKLLTKLELQLIRQFMVYVTRVLADAFYCLIPMYLIAGVFFFCFCFFFFFFLKPQFRVRDGLMIPPILQFPSKSVAIPQMPLLPSVDLSFRSSKIR